VEPQALRQPRNRQAVLADRAAGDVAAACDGDDAGTGPANHRNGEEGRGPGGEAGVAVEQARGEQAGTCRDLGDRRVGRGELDRAAPAAVDELEVSELADGLDGGDAPLSEFGPGPFLHE